MAFRLEDYPTIRLAHQVSQEVRYNRIAQRELVTRYGLTPIPIRRPVDGWTSGTVDCEVCGLRLDALIGSLQATARKRWNWVALSVLAAGIVALFVWYFLNGLDRSATATAAEALLGIGISVAGVVTGTSFFFYGLVKLSLEDGVRLEQPAGHRLIQSSNR